MDDQGIREWIQQSLPCAVCSLMGWESFWTHLTNSVKGNLKQWNTDVVSIPGGFTPDVQPKQGLLSSPRLERRMHPAKYKFSVGLKKQEWIFPEMVKKSFKNCCILNALDGTEDDAVFTKDSQEIE